MLQGPVLLLVEDNLADAQLVQQTVRESGMPVEVQVVTDGSEAIRYLAGEGEFADRERFPLPTALLLNLHLSGKSGFEVLEWVRNQPHLQALPIIVLANDFTSIQKAFRLGIHRYLLKPLSVEELRMALEEVMSTSPQHLKVLLVDDDPEVFPIVHRLLTQEFPDVEVTQVRTEQGWQQALATGAFDAVITDFLLPWNDGIQIARQVKERFPCCPVLMLTASGDEEVAAAALKAGVDDYIVKNPRHIVRLPVALRKAIREMQWRQTLCETEQRFQEFFNSVPVGLAMVDAEGRIIRANPALAELLGYLNPQDLQGVPVTEHLISESVADKVAATVLREGVAHREVPLRRKDGQICWAQISVRARHNAQGEVIGYELSVTDTTQRRLAEEALQQQRQLLEKVLQWGQEITRTIDLADCLRTIYRIVREEVGLDRVAIFLYDSDRQVAREVIGTDREGNIVEKVENEVPVEEGGIFAEAMRSPTGWVLTPDYTSTFNLPPDHSMFGVREHVVVALRVGEEVVGFLCADNLLSQRPITPQQLVTLQLLSNYAGIAIRGAKLLEERARRTELLEKVYRVSREISRVTGLRACILQIRNAIIHEFGMDRAAVWLYDPARDMFQGTFGTGRNGELTDEWDQFIRGDRSIRKALGQPAGFVHTLDYGATYHPVAPIMEGVKEHLSISLWAGDKPVGVITADMLLTQRPITPEQIEALRLFSSYAAVAIENARLIEALQQRTRQLETLMHLVHIASQRLDINSAAQAIVSELEESLPGAALFVFVGQGEGQMGFNAANEEGLSFANRSGLALGDSLDRTAVFPVSPSDEHIVCIALDEASTENSPFLRAAFEDGFGALLGCEMVWSGEHLGTIVALRRAPLAFTKEEAEFLHSVADHLAVILHNARLLERLRRTLDELKQTQAALVQQERLRALGQMASGVVHDINNALVPILTFAELLEDVKDEALREVTKYVKQAVDDITHTLQRLRAFYRPRDLVEEFAVVDLNKVIREVIEVTRPRWYDIPQQENITITVVRDLEEPLPPVWGNESELREAFLNLLFNAVDAIIAKRQREGIITVRTRHRNEWVVLEVEDTGVGMDEETRQRCFEPFFTTKETGTGLGLAMVYGIVQRHEGKIEVESEPGRGTLFRLWLPIGKGAPMATQIGETAASVPSLRILVVDDDPRVQEALRAMLEHLGHQPIVVDDGEKGVEAFEQALMEKRPFDLVITDLGMPKMGGAEVVEQVKALSPSTPVIVITGWGAEQRPPHADFALSKPVRISNLREAIAKVWQQQDDANK